jgi:hypothetical protein
VSHFQAPVSHFQALWQGRFKSLVVGVEGYFLSCARYIERSPLRAGLSGSRGAFHLTIGPEAD